MYSVCAKMKQLISVVGRLAKSHNYGNNISTLANPINTPEDGHSINVVDIEMDRI